MDWIVALMKCDCSSIKSLFHNATYFFCDHIFFQFCKHCTCRYFYTHLSCTAAFRMCNNLLALWKTYFCRYCCHKLGKLINCTIIKHYHQTMYPLWSFLNLTTSVEIRSNMAEMLITSLKFLSLSVMQSYWKHDLTLAVMVNFCAPLYYYCNL